MKEKVDNSKGLCECGCEHFRFTWCHACESGEALQAHASTCEGPQTEKERRLIREREGRYAAAEKRWNKT